jgi:hypothetical protein
MFQEPNFSNVLLVRQLFGHAVLKEVEENQIRLKEELEQRIGSLVLQLFPEAENVRERVHRLVGEAIEVSNMMAAEKSLFQRGMIETGDEFNPELMDSFDEGGGRVLLCMFPAFGIRVRVGDVEDLKIFVKAKVELAG